MPTPELPAVSHDLIVIGGSAGALPVLQEVLRGLPGDLEAAVLIVVHQAQSQPGRLPETLGGLLRTQHARDGEPIELGRVYVARTKLVDPRINAASNWP